MFGRRFGDEDGRVLAMSNNRQGVLASFDFCNLGLLSSSRDGIDRVDAETAAFLSEGASCTDKRLLAAAVGGARGPAGERVAVATLPHMRALTENEKDGGLSYLH